MEAIILAGGFGTRLKSVVADVPKPMAPVGTSPFLKYLIDYLANQQIKRLVICTGYKWQVIEQYFGSGYKGIEIIYSREDIPLGTGGAIKKAMTICESDDVFILNGDTLFEVDLHTMWEQHTRTGSVITLSLKEMEQSDRYGVVECLQDRVIAFHEKGEVKKGNINGGVYLLNTKARDLMKEDVFSFEKDFLERFVRSLNIHSCIFDAYFIDIGVPEDYIRAQTELISHE